MRRRRRSRRDARKSPPRQSLPGPASATPTGRRSGAPRSKRRPRVLPAGNHGISQRRAAIRLLPAAGDPLFTNHKGNCRTFSAKVVLEPPLPSVTVEPGRRANSITAAIIVLLGAVLALMWALAAQSISAGRQAAIE